VIPDEAVEAAAWVLHDQDEYLELFEDAPSYRRARYLEAARSVLEAAAPFMKPDFRESNLKAIAEEIATPLNFKATR
jgi:hypothetical protein